MRKSKIHKIFEEHEFNVWKGKDDYEVQRYTPEGEDWWMCFRKLEEVVEYAQYFDPEEEFTAFWEAKQNGLKGVPGPAELWKDQLWKQEELRSLAMEVEKCLN